MTSRSRTSFLAFAGVIAALASTASGLHAQQGPPNGERVRVLIGFDRAPGPAEQAAVRAAGGAIRHSYRLIPAIAASLPAQALNGLANAPGIAYVEPDGVATAFDLELDNTWGVRHIGSGTAHTADPPITGDGVLVAVLDTGIDATHPELAANYRADLSYDFAYDDPNPADGDGHGTHVSGTIGAAYNGSGVVGVAPGVEIMAIKVLDDRGSGWWSDIIAGLDWAVDHGARVTNSSFGSSSNPGISVANAYAAAEAAGVVNVAAAGNEGNCGGGGKGGASSTSVGYPARYTSVIAVGATNSNDLRPCFSSTGPEVAIAAPGVSIYSTIPGGGYALLSGTSMASPHVAGAAALLISSGLVTDENGNGQIGDDVRDVLESTAKDLGTAGRDTWYGFGLVDLVAAIDLLTGTTDPPDPPSGTIHVSGVTYALVTSGGGKGGTTTRTLRVTVGVQNGSNATVANASVSATISRSGTAVTSGTGATDTNGTVTFSLANPSSGCYSTTVTAVTAAGLVWTPTTTPANSYCISGGK